MRALVYHGPGRISWERRPRPRILAATDAVVRVAAASICDADLHIARGELREVAPGRILGHEAVGTVEEVGSDVRHLHAGDRVLVSSVSACGRCSACRAGHFSQCTGGGGWVLGHIVDGTQAEVVRIPLAASSLHRAPAGVSDEELVMLSDFLPAAYELGVTGAGIRPGDVVAVLGARLGGLGAILAAQLLSPSHVVALDTDDARLEAAKHLGADVGVNSAREAPEEVLHALTNGRGADVAIETFGDPASFALAVSLTRTGGHVANLGVHGLPSALHLERYWTSGRSVRTGYVDTSSIPALVRLVAAGLLDARRITTRHFRLEDLELAYDALGRAPSSPATKAVLAA